MIYEKDIRKVRSMEELIPGAIFYLKEQFAPPADTFVFSKCDVPLTSDIRWMQMTRKYFDHGVLYLNTKNPGLPVLYNML